ncbi:thiol-disulfide oxidoreductase ResA [Heyndrickxia oleronia]|uniref:Thiol-disulfide oxidoreductase ResA n=1 Tax=Heyndrickxia oleronia TaxID=38875 RepID=A0AAW6SMH2_9BACI|nr:thiol-disulfide oxidoreductase ResA [Heyndrickxia oleronia]MCM3236865.1 thiol-disulfide oxidoreductase ResA [Heyndrickxia oleronia]MDH5159986.1 thiol-disulfide oxidoreductase ResA [Heyndrickxia oleronia]
MSQKKKQRLVIRTIILVVLIAAVSYALYNNLTKDSRKALRVGDKAPDFVLQDMNGQKHRLSDYKGKGVFLNFWGTWCGPCKEEMPYMVDLYKEYKQQGVEILAANVGESNFLINKFIKSYDLNFPVLVDKSKDVQNAYGIDPIPTSFFIDSSGTIKKIVETTMSKEDIQNLMESIKP